MSEISGGKEMNITTPYLIFMSYETNETHYDISGGDESGFT